MVELLCQTPEHLWAIISNVCSALVGGLIAHYSAKSRDTKNDKDQLRRHSHGLLNSISFSLAMQYSQLYNLKKNCENRLSILNDPSKLQNRDYAIQVFQDFPLDYSSPVKTQNISDLFGAITEGYPKYQANPDIFQSCYLANKMYNDMKDDLKAYNEMKRSIDSKEANHTGSLIVFLNNNIPSYLTLLDERMKFIKRAQESLVELLTLVGKKTFQIDKPIKLWG